MKVFTIHAQGWTGATLEENEGNKWLTASSRLMLQDTQRFTAVVRFI